MSVNGVSSIASHCVEGKLVRLRYQLSLGVDPNASYRYQNSPPIPLPLLAAQSSPVSTIVETLILLRDFGCDLRTRDPELGRSILLESASLIRRRDLQYTIEYTTLLDFLVRNVRLNINETDLDEGCGVMHFAVLGMYDCHLIPILKKCIELGADPKTEDKQGNNTLVYIIKCKSVSLLMEVIEKIPEFRDEEILHRAIAKTKILSKERVYLKRWLNGNYI